MTHIYSYSFTRGARNPKHTTNSILYYIIIICMQYLNGLRVRCVNFDMSRKTHCYCHSLITRCFASYSFSTARPLSFEEWKKKLSSSFVRWLAFCCAWMEWNCFLTRNTERHLLSACRCLELSRSATENITLSSFQRVAQRTTQKPSSPFCVDIISCSVLESVH